MLPISLRIHRPFPSATPFPSPSSATRPRPRLGPPPRPPKSRAIFDCDARHRSLLRPTTLVLPLRFCCSILARSLFSCSLPSIGRVNSDAKLHQWLSRLWLDACGHVLISGIFMLSSLFAVNPVLSAGVGGAVDELREGFANPCEDVRGYYREAEGLEGAALMEKLNSIVFPHKALPYKEVWDALKILDAADVENPESSSDIVEIYSLRTVSKSLAGKPEGWNREHLWPRSYGLIDAASLTDLHNIRPADVNVNSSRGNKYYGECELMESHCLRPANKEAASDTETDKEKWAPPLQVRGDIARSLMYMAVSYGFHHPESSEMGLLSTLLKWNEVDPPSRAERLRNARICELYQHNRNPFIEHPEFAKLIWVHAVASRQATFTHSMTAWINELHYDNKGKDKNEFIEVVVRPSTDPGELQLILYNGATGRMYRSLSLGDKKFITVSRSGSGFLIYTAFINLQNGPADGIALISVKGNQPEVLQFISYEGTLRASDGPVEGLESVDIMVQETEESSEYDSLGLTGQHFDDFSWRQFRGKATPQKLNVGQTLS